MTLTAYGELSSIYTAFLTSANAPLYINIYTPLKFIEKHISQKCLLSELVQKSYCYFNNES